jgi:ribosomal protein L11 methyltransferase
MSIFQSGEKVKSEIPKFVEIEFPVSDFPSDALSGTLYSLGSIGIHEVDQLKWRVYFNAELLPDNVAEMISALKKLNPKFNEKDLTISEVSNRNWNEEWRKYFKPIEPANEIWIRPPWEELPKAAKGIEIVIDPQMAFGTGHHETTALVIRLMKGISLRGVTVLDIGTGSGILAILASKLGAGSIVAIDNDSDAIANTKRNTELNRINNIEIKNVPFESMRQSQFQIILANINREVLSSSISRIKGFLANGGRLIVSGVLREEAADIESLFKSEGLSFLKQENLNDWAAIIWEKPEA